MTCGEEATNIKTFQNGNVHTCDTHAKELVSENAQNYSPRRFRKYLEHRHKVEGSGIK